MDAVNTCAGPRYPLKTPVLKQIFDWYAEESITDEQIQRILEPVVRKIKEGRYDRSRLNSFVQPIKRVKKRLTEWWKKNG